MKHETHEIADRRMRDRAEQPVVGEVGHDADRVGSIEKGKDADLVIYDHHPLSVYAVVQKTIVDGESSSLSLPASGS